ncbi:hypothetical protein HOLleu_41882 [Holothuria leucospilota]|uniref:Uncharacterized protein n=1 Tax=Holothuria leucospilota TaxID=206669 RepID=A0A9Q1B9X3_HOLLE|nr:hypothetical protein HOLleu_41882 [Holothuria leucospilota]
MLRGRTLLFLVKVKGHLRSLEVKLRKPYKQLVYRFIMLRGRTLLFLVKVKGRLRSPEVKN